MPLSIKKKSDSTKFVQLFFDFSKESVAVLPLPGQDETPLKKGVSSLPTMGESADCFGSYLRSITDYPLLTPEEELELILTARSNRKEAAAARERLILCNLKLVISLAKKYTRFGCPIEDLVSEGNIGLQIAIEKYKPEKGAKLSTYSVWWIKQHLRKAVSEHTRTIKIPIYQQKTVRMIHATAAKLQEITGHYPTDEEIADELELPTEKVRNLRNLTVPMVSLNAPVGNGQNERTYEDVLSDCSGAGESPLEQLAKQSSILPILEARLNKREQEVIRLRFGLGGDDSEKGKTLEEVGHLLKLTRERIRQIQEGALKKLRQTMQAHDTFRPTLLSLGLS